MDKMKYISLLSGIKKLALMFKQLKCDHLNWEWQWWDASYRIKHCNDCGLDDFGWGRDFKGRNYTKWIIK